jgi:cytochrome c oxidase assembly factor CtaG
VTAAPTIARLLGSWSLDPVVGLALLAAAVLYALGIRRRAGWPRWRTASFSAGLLALAVALMSGVERDSEELLSVHMVQHLLLSLVAPALLLAAAPLRLALAAGSPPMRAALAAMLRSRTAKLLSRPATGFALFAATVLASHLSVLFELALERPVLHALGHAALFWSGVLLLAPLIAADPIPHPPRPLARFAWMMAAMTAMAVPGALLAFDGHVRYPHYLLTARSLGRSALTDQQLAGAIMWIAGTLAMFALALAVTFGAMLREERRQRRREQRLSAAAQGTREEGALRA